MRLVVQAARRLDRLKAVVEETSDLDPAVIDRRTAFVTIETWNLWSGFCRSFYLSVAMGAKDGSGRRISSARGPFRTQDEALTFVILQLKPKIRKRRPPWNWLDEPQWGDADQFIRAMTAVGPANIATIHGAVSLATANVLQDLPPCRHFFAHRSEETARSARRVALGHMLPTYLHPTSILNSYPPGRPQTLLCDWLDEMRTVIELMV